MEDLDKEPDTTCNLVPGMYPGDRPPLQINSNGPEIGRSMFDGKGQLKLYWMMGRKYGSRWKSVCWWCLDPLESACVSVSVATSTEEDAVENLEESLRHSSVDAA